ncbi:MAG: hypothetical protein SFU87_11400 [Chitinophagaceae bacterium]|nr:hypothetical protein [Chitinophagaceae bacterium]
MPDKTYNIRMHGIDIIEKHLFKISIQEADLFKFELKTQSIVNETESLIVTFVIVEIRKESTNELAAKILAGFGFFIKDISSSLERGEDRKYIIPSEFENVLKTISISTMRGLMFSEFRGTPLHGAILPIIRGDSLVPINESIIELAK